MAQYIIPLDAIPNQSFEIQLGKFLCKFEFISRGVYLYMNLKVEGEEKLNGIICQNRNKLIQYNTIDIGGDLYFVDTQGDLDPIYWGLNSRWILVYEVKD